MKILHICSGWPLSFRGGITNYVRSLAEAQFLSGNSVTILGAPDSLSYKFEYIPYISKIKPFSYGPLIDKESLTTIKELLLCRSFDIIHLHAVEGIDWDLYEVLKPYHYIVSLHDYYFICPRIYMFQKGKVCEHYDKVRCSQCISYLDRISIIHGGIERVNRLLPFNISVPHIKQSITSERYEKFSLLLNNADFVLPVSRKVEEIYINSGITAKSRMLHIGNESANTYKEEDKYDISPHTLKLVFLGRLTTYKGADLFFRIAKELRANENVQLYFLGRSGEFQKSFKKLGIIDMGPYNPNDLGSILPDYDMGMVLSIWHDNGPQVVMELLNNHVPVFGTKMGGIPDFVNKQNGYLFNPYSEKDIQDAIVFLKNLNPSTIAEYKKNIRRTTTTYDHYIAIMKVYEDAISNTRD